MNNGNNISISALKWWQMILPLLLTFYLLPTVSAQTSDSVIVHQMEAEGVRFTQGNQVRLLMSGKDKFADMFEAIRQAKSSVHLEYFNFRNDSIASLLFDILREKRKEGVEVRAMFDGFGNDSNNQPLKKRHLRKLRADSINIVEYDPIRFPWVNHIWPRDHRKIVIIDGEIAYTGGMNVADYYIVGTEQVGEWRDMHCRLEGPVVNDLQTIFARIWKKATKEDLTAQSITVASPPAIRWWASSTASPMSPIPSCADSISRPSTLPRTPSASSTPTSP